MTAIVAPIFATKQQLVYAAIKNAIRQGQLEPGQRLIVSDLSRQFGASSSPIREALQQLQAEHWVDFEPNIGFRVAVVTVNMADEVFLLLATLEGLAARAASERTTPENLDELESYLGTMEAAVPRGDHGAWTRANSAFHLRIAAFGGLPLLEKLLITVSDRRELVQRLLSADKMQASIERAGPEHRAIFEALHHHDPQRAEQAAVEHNRMARQAAEDVVGH